MRPNPMIPVIVNVSTLGVNLPNDYTRVFGIVSYGDTNLEAGTLKRIDKNNIEELELKKKCYTQYFLDAFFMNNPKGVIYVLESHTVPNIKQYAVGDYYIEGIKAYKCLKVDTATSEDDLKPVNLLQSSYWEDTQTPKVYAINDLYRDGYKVYECIQQDNAKALTDLVPTNLSSGDYWKDVTQSEIEEAVEILENNIKDAKVRVYEWACPTIFYKNTDFIALVKSYAGLTASQYFSIELPLGTNPNEDPTFALYTKVKSFAPVYPSSVEGESVNGAIVGIKAGSKYNLTTDNTLTLLQWKTVLGITPSELNNSMVLALNNNGCTWIGTLNNNVVLLGGMVADGKGWEHYFALDTYIYQLVAGMSTSMIQGSNVASAKIPFNQIGLNTVQAILESISSKMVGLGVLDQFGANYDNINKAILDTNTWKMVDFATYKANSYEKYQNGIYDGASVYATIAKFVLQVIPNITIE